MKQLRLQVQARNEKDSERETRDKERQETERDKRQETSKFLDVHVFGQLLFYGRGADAATTHKEDC